MNACSLKYKKYQMIEFLLIRNHIILLKKPSPTCEDSWEQRQKIKIQIIYGFEKYDKVKLSFYIENC